MLVEKTLREFVDAVAAKASVPGGGSVSAYASAMGTALGIMTARYSQGPEAEQTVQRLEKHCAVLLVLVDRDAESYARFTEAKALPKGTDEEKRSRKKAIEKALEGAANAPLAGMQLGNIVLMEIDAFAPKCNRNLASDLGVAAGMLRAGVEGCAWNVLINAAGFADASKRSALQEECARLREEAGRLSASIARTAEKLMAS